MRISNTYFKQKNADIKSQITSSPQISHFSSKNYSPSFNGLERLIYKYDVKIPDYQSVLKVAAREIGDSGDKLFEKLKSAKGIFGKDIRIVDDALEFREGTFLKSVFDSATFPVKDLPLLIADYFLKLGQKIPVISKAAKKAYNSDFMTVHRLKDSVNMLKGLLVTTTKAAKNSGKSISDIIAMDSNPEDISNTIFKKANKYLDPHTGNYNTAHERPLNRIVTGMVSAFFLANDAYNLSVICGDKSNASKKEKKLRFRQEVARVFTTAYLQLMTLGALASTVNKNPYISASVSAGTVLISEIFSRISAGKPVSFVSPQKAKEINKKESDKKNKDKNSNIEQKSDDKVDFTQLKIQMPNVFSLISHNNVKFAGKDKSEDKKEDKKTLFSFKTLGRMFAIFGGLGIAFSTLRYNPKLKDKFFAKSIDNLKGFWDNKVFKKLAQKDFAISENDFTGIIEKLNSIGKGSLAANFEKRVLDARITKGVPEGIIKLNDSITKKAVLSDKPSKILVEFVIEPFKFAWGAVTLPYKAVKNILNSFSTSIENSAKNLAKENKVEYSLDSLKGFKKKYVEFCKNLFGEIKDKKKISNEESLSYNLQKLVKKVKQVNSGKISEEDFEKFVDDSIIRSFNDTTQSSVSNAELAKLTKLASSLVTSGFLVADNYNMVMLKSNGENKQEAKQKAQERVVQRISSLFYQTLFMQLFNSSFSKIYHGSLLGNSAVSMSSQATMEVFTRSSIGMPIASKSYDELVAQDEKNAKRKGFAGAYFRFMMKLTGKKPLENKNKTVTTKQQQEQIPSKSRILDFYKTKK